MDFLEVIEKRKSVRKYTAEPVKKSVLESLITAASLAPSSLNQQPWRFLVVLSKEKKDVLKKVYTEARKKQKLYEQDVDALFKATPILVFCEKTMYPSTSSCWTAIENMVLAATNKGLGAVCMNSPVTLEEDRVIISRIFKAPENLEPVALVMVGHADENPEPKPRKNLREIMFTDSF